MPSCGDSVLAFENGDATVVVAAVSMGDVAREGSLGGFPVAVVETAYRPRSPAALRVELERQLTFQTEPSEDGL